MAYTSFSTSVMSVNKAITSTFLYQLKNNAEWAFKSFAYNVSSLIPNGNFELVQDDKPALWSITTVTNGMIGVSTQSYCGGHSLMFVCSGERYSGGEAWTDYIPVSTLTAIGIDFVTWGAQINMNGWFYFYAGDFTTLGSSRVYSASARSATVSAPTAGSGSVTLPANTRWIRFMFVNETSVSDTVAGNVYFDMMRLSVAS